ncbi:MAG: hypothetical protein H5T98_00530 [Syntrophomonadaceae bacterium]|nr:hypothetical protein [Syntrophomonadaceae bacterium]
MTELQKAFLFFTFFFYLVKGGLYVALYVATVVVEKHARRRQAKIRAYLQKKRIQEAKSWKVAYDLYHREYQLNNTQLKKAG